MKIITQSLLQKTSVYYKNSLSLKPALALSVAIAFCTAGCTKVDPSREFGIKEISTIATLSKSVRPTVDLKSADDFAMLSQTGITTTGVTKINGNIGVGPIASTAMTGFALEMSEDNSYSSSDILLKTKKAYAPDYAGTTPEKIATAVNDMQDAFTNANKYKANFKEFSAGNFNDNTILTPGIYNWATSVLLNPSAVIKLKGGPTDVFIFQIGTTLTVGSNVKIKLIGVKPENVFWIVGTAATFGTDVSFEGSILAKTAITLEAGDDIKGNLYAQTAITMIADKVTPVLFSVTK